MVAAVQQFIVGMSNDTPPVACDRAKLLRIEGMFLKAL
jgi:hypothetical protein